MRSIHVIISFYNIEITKYHGDLTKALRPSLHSTSQIIAQNLSSISTQLTSHAPFLSSLTVYPLPSYPGREHENILNQLLRKKLEPRIEEWVGDGREKGLVIESQGGRNEVEKFWQWAMQEANEQARKQPWEGEFTLEEIEGGIEKVNTGLKRKWYDESDDEEEDEEESQQAIHIKEEDSDLGKVHPLEIDDFLRFMAKGIEPEKEDSKNTSKLD